jgi:hypothetical protein
MTEERVPAKQTIEFMMRTEKKFDTIESTMNNLSTEIKLMKKDVQVVCEKLEQNTAEHKEIISKIDKFIESADKRYAKSEVEKIVYRLIFSIAIFAVLTIVYIVMEHVGLPKP